MSRSAGGTGIARYIPVRRFFALSITMAPSFRSTRSAVSESASEIRHPVCTSVAQNVLTSRSASSACLQESLAFDRREVLAVSAVVIKISHAADFRNPHDLARTPLGSSGGSAIAVAAAYTVIAVGTDTGGSVRLPSSTTGIVGLKPTHGLVSCDGVIPLAPTLDTAGPMARNVHDVAAALSVIAGPDPNDPATTKSAGHIEWDYTKFLRVDALKAARIGVARDFMGFDPDVDWATESALSAIRRAGAEVVDVHLPKWLLDSKGEFYNAIRYPEFAAYIPSYLKTLGPAYPKNIEQLISKATEVNAPGSDGAGQTRTGGQ
jgi:Asp-tRNA(Asn)/Glu-tRNA(Gln) amidotransferase A subunit family amidase